MSHSCEGAKRVIRKKDLRIQISYEVNRLAEIHLSDAYEKLLPTIRKQINVSKEIKNDIENATKVNLKRSTK